MPSVELDRLGRASHSADGHGANGRTARLDSFDVDDDGGVRPGLVDVETGGSGVGRSRRTGWRSLPSRVLGRLLGKDTPLANTTWGGVCRFTRIVFNYPEGGVRLRRTAWLDGLRGMAAYNVMMYHYTGGMFDARTSWGTCDGCEPDAWWRAPFLRSWFAGGACSVPLFFVISAYALSYRALTLTHTGTPEDVLNALSSGLLRRPIRLYLPILVMSTVHLFGRRYFGLGAPWEIPYLDSLLADLYRLYIHFQRLWMPLKYPDRWDELQNPYDGGISWTIPLEFYGSLVVFIMMLAMVRIDKLRFRALVCFFVSWQTIARDDWIGLCFVLGLLYGDWAVRRAHRPTPFVWSAWATRAWIALFVFGWYLHGIPPARSVNETEDDFSIHPRPFYNWAAWPANQFNWYHTRQIDRMHHIWASMSILMGMGEVAALRGFLETRPIQYLGRLSFGIYLCHVTFGPSIHRWEWDYAWWAGFTPGFMQGFVKYLLFVIFNTFAVCLVAAQFERFLDRPSVTLAKRFETWCIGGKPKQAAAQSQSQAHAAATGAGNAAPVDIADTHQRSELDGERPGSEPKRA